MRAVVIYESMFGNTRTIAYAVGAGLGEYFDVEVVPVALASPASYEDADIVVVGGPTHVHGMSRPSTRQGAAKQSEPRSGLWRLAAWMPRPRSTPRASSVPS